MMLKQLGMFAILAVCLFAVCFLVITMGGCQDRLPGIVKPPPIEPPPVELPPPTETAPEGMVLIPAGSFQMGSDAADADDDEQPVHTVHLDAFYMDVYEVTNAQFKVFVDANPEWQKGNISADFRDTSTSYLFAWSGTDYPAGTADDAVEDVSWYAAMAYAQWAGKRLPTEAEWEYAARGGLAGKTYPWGDAEPTPADANYGKDHGGPTPVGKYAANGYGLYDMAGNVDEWCLDEYDADFYAESDGSRNPIAGRRTIQWLRENFTSIPSIYDPDGYPHSDGYHQGVVRGGSVWDYASDLRVANRYWDTPADGYGFRCVRDVTP